MERAEPLVTGSGLPQRHVLLHDLQDIGLQAEVVDEGLGKQRHVFAVSPSVLQFDHCDAASTMLRRRRLKPRDQRMLLEKTRERALQLAGAVAVDEADLALVA